MSVHHLVADEWTLQMGDAKADQQLLEELEPLPGEEDTAHLARITQLNKDKGKMLNHAAKQLYLKNYTKRGKTGGPQEERAARKELANRQLVLECLRKIPEHDRQVMREIGVEPIYESPNSIGWLEDMEAGCAKKRGGEEVVFVWALKFKMPQNSSHAENEQLALMSTNSRAKHHVDSEPDDELAGRTVHITDIPMEHIHLPDSPNPEPSPELLTKLNATGEAGTEVDTVTLTNARGAQSCSQEGLTVSAPDRTSENSGHHLIPDKILTVTMLDHRKIGTDPSLEAAFGKTKERQKAKEQMYRAMPITHEAWATADRCIACDLEVAHHVTADKRHLLITVAATTENLVQEAKVHGTQMRLAETKGMMKFHPDLISYYATNLGGLNEATVTEASEVKWAPRDSASAADWAKRPERTEKNEWEDPNSPTRKIFTSAIAQQLVLKRMQRLGHIDPYVQRSCPDAQRALDYLKKRVCRVKRKRVTAEKCHELLLGFGGYRPYANDTFPRIMGRPVVRLLADACIKDPLFILHSDGLLQSNVFSDADRGLPSFSMLIDVCRVFEAWQASVGREEEFIGSMTDFFPLHVDTELRYLRQNWGRFGILWQMRLTGYAPESELKKDKKRPDRISEAEHFLENNTHGSVANTPSIYEFPWTLVYQPLEEIKDYFGDDVGLYFCWLDRYTRALFLMSFYGTFVFFRQVTQHEGPDDNPLTVIYSIYCGVWSILFLQAWNRRETELRFLWGLDRMKHEDETRREFINGPNSTLEVNPDTGRQNYIVKNKADQWCRKGISLAWVLVLMFFTVLSATGAILVRYAGETEETEIIGIGGVSNDLVSNDLVSSDLVVEDVNETSDGSGTGGAEFDGVYEEMHHYFYSRKWELLSAFLGLFLIVVYGAIFEGFARQLTNYENHRTQTEYDDALIAKNFMFQFVNNYWALIYIAYLREIPDPLSNKAHPCENGSCLSELQFQVGIVFAFKTVGKQIGFTLRPFIVKAVKAVYANRLVAKSTKMVGETRTAAGHLVKDKVPGGDKFMTLQAEMAQEMASQYGNVLDAAFGEEITDVEEKTGKLGLNYYEIQDSLLSFTSTFNDFNDRTVQFGYIVLFAPAFPLAPLLAFVNNIVEIRAAGYKLCNGYRRPVVKHRNGLGTWMVVLNILGFLAVIMNSTMINFVGRQNAKNFGVPDVPGFWEDESTTEYNQRLGGGHGMRVEDNSGMMGRLNVAPLWYRFFIVEHLSMFVRILVFALTPDTPFWIKTARETLEYRIESVYQTNDMIDAERRYREKYEAALSQHMEDIGNSLEEALTVKSLTEQFQASDTSGSGALTTVELGSFLARLGVILRPVELEEAMREIDTESSDGESLATFDMIVVWLRKLGLLAADDESPGTTRSNFHSMRTPETVVMTAAELWGNDLNMEEDALLVRATVRIQSVHRGKMIRKENLLKHEAATKIQKHHRGKAAREKVGGMFDHMLHHEHGQPRDHAAGAAGNGHHFGLGAENGATDDV